MCIFPVSEEPSIIEELLVPFKGISTFVKERSDSLALQTEQSTIFGWLKKSRSASTPTVMPSDNDLENQDQLSTSETLPDVVKLDTEDCTPVKLDISATVTDNVVPKIEISVPILGNENDDIVYKPKKKPKKRGNLFILSSLPFCNYFLYFHYHFNFLFLLFQFVSGLSVLKTQTESL